MPCHPCACTSEGMAEGRGEWGELGQHTAGDGKSCPVPTPASWSGAGWLQKLAWLFLPLPFCESACKCLSNECITLTSFSLRC